MMQRIPWRKLAAIVALLALAPVACGSDTSGERSESDAEPSGGGAGEGVDMRLISAAGQNDIRAVKRLLDAGASVAARDETGRPSSRRLTETTWMWQRP